MNSKPSESASNSFLLDAWERHEKIAMHFNDLILKVRIQALGALAAVVTVGGVLLKTVSPEQHLPWGGGHLRVCCLIGFLCAGSGL